MRELIIDLGARTRVVMDLPADEIEHREQKAASAVAAQQATKEAAAVKEAARPAKATILKILAGENLTAAESQAVLRFLALHYVGSRDSE